MLAEQARRYVPSEICRRARGELLEAPARLTGPEWERLYADFDAADLPLRQREDLRRFLNKARTLAAMEAMLATHTGICVAWEEAQRYPARVLRRVEYAPHRAPRRRKVKEIP